MTFAALSCTRRPHLQQRSSPFNSTRPSPKSLTPTAPSRPDESSRHDTMTTDGCRLKLSRRNEFGVDWSGSGVPPRTNKRTSPTDAPAAKPTRPSRPHAAATSRRINEGVEIQGNDGRPYETLYTSPLDPGP
jgi:hypothetical protein